MKIAIIGSSQYRNRMAEYAEELREVDHEVWLPALDDDFPDGTALDVSRRNREGIEWAEEVHVFWDQRSVGTIFDFGMCFALRRMVRIKYLEPKTLSSLMREYAKGGDGE